MKSAFLVFLFPFLIFAEPIDLGKEGHTYKIKEENFYTVLKKDLKPVQEKFTRKYIKQKILTQLHSEAVGHTTLPFCQEDKKFAEYNTQKLKMDIYKPNGEIWKHKGDKFIINNKKPLDICYIAGNNIEIENQIKFFNNISQQLSHSNCNFIVADRNAFALDKEHKPQIFYPTHKGLEELYNVKCYPTIIHFQGKKRFKMEMTMEQFKHRGDTK